MTLTSGSFALPETGLIALDGPDVGALWFTAVTLQESLFENAQLDYELVGGTAVPQAQVVFQLSVIPGSVRHEQGYELTITNGRVDAVANHPAGLFYAVQTIIQLLEQVGSHLPTLRYRDRRQHHWRRSLRPLPPLA